MFSRSLETSNESSLNFPGKRKSQSYFTPGEKKTKTDRCTTGIRKKKQVSCLIRKNVKQSNDKGKKENVSCLRHRFLHEGAKRGQGKWRQYCRLQLDQTLCQLGRNNQVFVSECRKDLLEGVRVGRDLKKTFPKMCPHRFSSSRGRGGNQKRVHEPINTFKGSFHPLTLVTIKDNYSLKLLFFIFRGKKNI